MTTTFKKEMSDVDWPFILLLALALNIAVACIVGLTQEVRFHRNFAVGCAAAGGIVVKLDGTPSCVTVTPVSARVVR